MKIFLTGGCGFIGSNFVIKQILNENNIIMNYDKLTYSGNRNNLIKISSHKNYNFTEGDICDNKLLYDTINQFKPDLIIHFAAESHVDRSIDNPARFIQTNVLGTFTLLDVANSYYKNNKLNDNEFKFIHISTDEVYGSINNKNEFFNENSQYNPSSPYSASKAGSDHLIRAWYKTFDFPAIITNCSNNYGPYQFPEKLIPLMIANIMDEKPLPIYGTGNNIRDWLFVEDHCDAIFQIALKGSAGDHYNIGGNNELSNIQIVKTICNIFDKLKPRKNGKKYSDLINYVEDRPGHDYRYAINANKIRDEIGWTPKESFHTGITKTINWYIKNESWWRKIQKKLYNQERLGLKDS